MNEPYTGDVFDCMASFQVDGQTQIRKAGLIFVEGFPFAVLEWQDVPGGLAPSSVAKMNPKWLTGPNPPTPGAEYVYQAPIKLPDDLLY